MVAITHKGAFDRCTGFRTSGVFCQIINVISGSLTKNLRLHLSGPSNTVPLSLFIAVKLPSNPAVPTNRSYPDTGIFRLYQISAKVTRFMGS